MANIKIPRENIIEAAFEITRESGIEAATAAAIAKKLQISERPVFWAFGTIDNLRSLVLKRTQDFYLSFMKQEHPNRTKAASLSLNYIHFARDYPHLFDLVYSVDKSENIDTLNTWLDEYRPKILNVIKDNFNMNDDQAKEIRTVMSIFNLGLATMLKSQLINYTDEEILALLGSVFEKISK